MGGPWHGIGVHLRSAWAHRWIAYLEENVLGVVEELVRLRLALGQALPLGGGRKGHRTATQTPAKKTQGHAVSRGERTSPKPHGAGNQPS